MPVSDIPLQLQVLQLHLEAELTNGINELLEADVIFVMGSNTTENHPVIGAKIRQALRKGSKLIVADPRKIELSMMQILPADQARDKYRFGQRNDECYTV